MSGFQLSDEKNFWLKPQLISIDSNVHKRLIHSQKVQCVDLCNMVYLVMVNKHHSLSTGQKSVKVILSHKSLIKPPLLVSLLFSEEFSCLFPALNCSNTDINMMDKAIRWRKL